MASWRRRCVRRTKLPESLQRLRARSGTAEELERRGLGGGRNAGESSFDTRGLAASLPLTGRVVGAAYQDLSRRMAAAVLNRRRR